MKNKKDLQKEYNEFVKAKVNYIDNDIAFAFSSLESQLLMQGVRNHRKDQKLMWKAIFITNILLASHIVLEWFQ